MVLATNFSFLVVSMENLGALATISDTMSCHVYARQQKHEFLLLYLLSDIFSNQLSD